MNRYQKAIRYTKPIAEIDEKINRLNEMMTTTGFYNDGTTTDALPEIPPTIGEIGDQFLGDFSDPSSLVQNVDYDNVSQLSSDDASGTSSPINSVMDTSNLGLADGVSALAMATNGRPAQGVVYGYIDSNNVFNGVFTIGGMAASGYGTNDAIDDGLDWYFEYVAGKTVTTVPWKCYNSPSIWDGLYTPHATDVGPGGNYNLHTNSLLHVKSENFNTDNGRRKTFSKYTVLDRFNLGDPNFYPGPIAMGPNTLWEMIDEYRSPATPAYMKQNILKGLSDWAKPGSNNRRKLQGLGLPLV